MDQDEIIRSRIRKHRNTLNILGTGTMALGIWNVIKFIIGLISTPKEILDELFAEQIYTDNMMLLILILIVLLGGSMALYLYAGDRARAEGRGKKRRSFYIGVVFLLSLMHTLSALYIVITLLSGYDIRESVLSIIVAVIVDMTAAITLAEMGWSAVMIRKYQRMAITEK